MNVCYDELRRTRRRGEVPLESDEEEGLAIPSAVASEPSPDRQAAAEEEADLVRHALLQLPEIYRTVLVLRHYESLKLAKIAEVLEIPEGTVNSRMAEGLARLTRILEPQLGESKGRRTPEQDPAKEILVL